jgi:hypothetical protein
MVELNQFVMELYQLWLTVYYPQLHWGYSHNKEFVMNNFIFAVHRKLLSLVIQNMYNRRLILSQIL